MSKFPVLKTGAVSQYPLGTATRFQTQSVRFLDGSQQKFALYAGLKRWSIELDLLDDSEFAAISAFSDQQGSASFSFTDPVSGTAYPKCVLSEDKFELTGVDEGRGRVRLAIEEIA